MALRKSSVLTGLVALGFSCWVTALGLGELTLHSALDEPFNAEIELVNIGDADENQILVGLASKEDFERAGVTREFHLLNLKFKTDLSDAEHPVIKVTSKESIREPYLDFVAQLQWPSGRLLREYTLFLDLPVFDTQKAAPVTKAVVSSASAKKTPTKADVRTNKVSAAQQQSSGPTSPVTSSADYRVKGGDTLWQIATRAEFGETTVQQRMVAIHSANPRAFVNGDANLLKKGAVLRMPDLANVESINPREANQRVADQARDWNKQHEKSAARELIGDVPVATQSGQAKTKDGMLRLSTPDETSSSTSAKKLGRAPGSVGDSTSPEVLQNELGIAQEELDRTQRENLELKAKLAGLEEQLSTTSKLLELEDDELKALQLGVSADKEAVEAVTEADSSSTEELGTETAAVDTAAVVGDSAGVGDKAPENEGVTKGPQSGLFTFLQSNWMPLIGFVVVLLGVLFLVAKSKKEDQPELLEPFLSTDTDTPETEQESPLEVEAPIEEEPLLEPEPSVVEPESQEVAPLEVVEDVDPIGEADIYQSMGNFGEAESVIEKAIDTSPNDSKLLLKRLDLFAAQQDADGFDAYYPGLVALGDAAATATADRLRANIPEEVFEEPVDSLRELTIEEQVAEELGIDGLELDLSGTAEPAEDDSLSADIEADLDDSFVDSDEGELDLSEVELDLSEIELDLTPSSDTPASASEEPSENLDASMFGDISLPDELEELSADIPSEETSAAIEIELPDAEIDEIVLEDVQLEGVEQDEGLELSLDSFDFDSDDDLDLEIDGDESSTQLELAQAYIEMGDETGAKDILADVVNNGSEEQKQQANELLAKLS